MHPLSTRGQTKWLWGLRHRDTTVPGGPTLSTTLSSYMWDMPGSALLHTGGLLHHFPALLLLTRTIAQSTLGQRRMICRKKDYQ